jgi:hypothetical protein
MLSYDLVKDLAFSDPVRRLQRGASRDSSSSSESGFHQDNMIYILFWLVMIFLVAVACFRIHRTSMARRRLTAMAASELPENKTVSTTTKSTLSKRRQAMLELFKTAQVTMVSSDVDGTLH